MLVASITSFVLTKIQHLPGGLVYTLVALLVFGEAALFIGFVLPGETSVLVAGVVASQHHVRLTALIPLVIVAAVVGDSVGYEVGRHFGHRLMDLPVLRRRQAALHRALTGLRTKGARYVVLGRFTAFLRAVMPGLAGMSGMAYRRFLAANALGGVIWGVSYTLLGFYAGSALSKVETYSSWAGIGLLVLVLGGALALHLLRRRRDLAVEAAYEAEHPEGSAQGGE